MSDNRNLILAIVLSAIVLFGWTFVAERYLPTANPRPNVIKGGEEMAVPKPGADPTADSPAAIRDRQAVLAETPRVQIRSPRLSGSINLRGARIDDLMLTRYHETITRGSPNIRLFSPAGTRDAYFAEFGWTGSRDLPNASTLWKASGAVLEPGRPVTLSHTNALGQTFEIELKVDDAYMFTATQRVRNGSAQAVVARPYSLVQRTGISADKDSFTVHIGPMGVFEGSFSDINYEDIREADNQQLRYGSTGGWLGFSDKYWLSALVPGQKDGIDAMLRHAGGDRYQLDITQEPVALGPQQSMTTTSHLFAGAKEVDVLQRYEKSFGIPLFDRAIDWGWFEPIEKPIFYLLDWLFRLFGNFGLAIIGLTVIVRLLMFPIANRQFASMAKMRALQPRMKAIQERYKDDKLQMQQEMMKLYQTEKVNPVSGCLPILIQIPVFYGLYKVLIVTIEMRHQPFFGWIRDLSAPDPLTPVNLFGLLPFQPPSFLAIGVLPILVGVTMWLQQKLNPQPLDEMQAKVFGIMPWIFMFIMAPFAAGLQLYWAVSNTLSIGQQWLLTRRHPMQPASAAKAK